MKRFPVFLVAFALLFGIGVSAGFVGEVPEAHASSYTYAYTSNGVTYTYTSTQPIDASSFLDFKGGDEKTIQKGKSKKLKVTGSSGRITWKSSSKKVATVSKKGMVKAKKAGKAVITAKDKSTGATAKCTVKVYAKRTQAQARKSILSLQGAYYEGRTWTNGDYYFWEAANMGCYGCIAFAGIASDKAFGKYAPLKKHGNFSKVKVGDHIRIGNYHSVVVLEKKPTSVVVCEGNFNSSMHWGREITYNELVADGFSVWTRY